MKEYNPYTYLIGWRKLDIWYYGARYKQGANPSDLWNPYKTSSDVVNAFIEANGDPDVIRVHKVFKTRNETLEYEERFQLRVNAVHSPRWLNKHTRGGKWFNYPGYYKFPEKRRKQMSDLQKGKVWWNDGVSETKSKECPGDGWQRGRITKRSPEEMRSIVKGKVWWNNGKEQTRAVQCPEGWMPGRLADTDASRENKRKMRLGKTHSQETKQKIKEAWERRRAR